MKPIQVTEEAYYAENFNVAQFKWVTYGAWGYGANHDEAHADAKRKVYKKCKEENPHLNFDEVIDYRNDVRSVPNNPLPNNNSIDTTTHNPDGNVTSILNKSIKLNGEINPEKINKGTIEEQIEACTTLDELKTFKYVAEMNSKLNMLFHGKENELSLKKML